MALDSLYETFNNLIARISGVSDYVLQEQLAEEYTMLLERIHEAENKYVQEQIASIAAEHKDFYLHQYKEEPDITSALDLSNPDQKIREFIKSQKLRPPTLLSDRRTLCMLANHLNQRIAIKDLESYTIDEIGNSTTDTHLTLYVTFFSRFDDYESCDITSIKPAVLVNPIS